MTSQQGAPEALRLADKYAAAHAKWALEDLYGTSESYTAEMLAERHAARERLAAALVEAQQPARIAELEAELEAVGAGGVQALSAAPAGPWSLGEMTGNWRDIDLPDHGGVMRIVWKMEDDEGSNEVLEAQAHAVVAALNAASPTPPAEQQAPADAQLCKFYGVTTDAELIAAQARHIERLQAKLPQTPSFAPQRVREG